MASTASHGRSSSGTVVGYDVPAGSLYVDRRRSGRTEFHPAFAAVHRVALPTRDGRLSLSVIVDRASVEAFGNHGEQTITDQIFPGPDSTGVELFAEGGTARLVYLTVTGITSPITEHDMHAQLDAS